MEFQVALKMRNFDELQARIAQGETLSFKEMEARYYPLAADHQSLLNWLKGEGLTVQSYPHRLNVVVRGTAAQVEKALGVKFSQVVVEGKSYVATSAIPSLPESLSAFVLGVNGLQPYQHAEKFGKAQPFSPTNPFRPPFSINDLKTAYNVTGTLNGSGQKMGIVIDVFPLDSDLTTFWANQGIPQSLSNIEKVAVGGSASSGTRSGEETLDVEMTSGLAPAAKVRIYASGSLSFVDLDRAYSQLVADLPTQPDLHQVSISLGACEQLVSNAELTTESQFFASMAAAGVSVYVSSGDSGSRNNCIRGNRRVSYPASDPSVTSVGGTALTLDQTTGAVTSEVVWFNNNNSATGGGTSSFFARPSWQVGVGVPSGRTRLVPDVSLVADPNTGVYVIFNGSTFQFGGTSVSAPLWNALSALINQSRIGKGLSPLGLLNPRVYPLIGTTAPFGAPNFRDITSGSNGAFTAGPGYDQTNGIGVPVFSTLLTTLSP